MKEKGLFRPALFMTVLIGALVNQVLLTPLVNKFLNKTSAAA
jgi:hypothetical protein